MAFPTPVGTPGVLIRLSNGTTHDVPYPTVPGGILADDILWIIAGIDESAAGMVGSTITNWNGFTELDWADLLSSPTAAGGIAWKRAVGGETGTLTITSSNLERSAAMMYCIRGCHATSAPEIGTVAGSTTSGANPDPGSTTASWGAEDNLWMAWLIHDTVIPSAAPTDYTDLENTFATSGASVSTARRQLNAATEDPGVFTAAADQWRAGTIVFRPAAVGGGQLTGNLGQVVETDTAQAITERKSKAVNLQTEADTLQPVGRRKRKAISLLTEADTAQPVTRRRQRTLAQTSEVDTPQPLGTGTPQLTATLGLIVESVTLFGVTKRKSKGVSQASELETSFSLTRSAPISRSIGLVTEIDSFPPEPSGLTRRKLKGTGQVIEADTLNPVVRREHRTLGLIMEIDTVQSVILRTRISRTLSLLVETDTPNPFFVQRGTPVPGRPRYYVSGSLTNVRRRAR